MRCILRQWTFGQAIPLCVPPPHNLWPVSIRRFLLFKPFLSFLGLLFALISLTPSSSARHKQTFLPTNNTDRDIGRKQPPVQALCKGTPTLFVAASLISTWTLHASHSPCKVTGLDCAISALARDTKGASLTSRVSSHRLPLFFTTTTTFTSTTKTFSHLELLSIQQALNDITVL